jgi:membrane protease YdiL (CAAX protease family)
MSKRPMSADSRRALLVFFGLVVALSGVFDYFAIHYKTGSFKIMWSAGIAALLTMWICKRDLRTMGWGWGQWRWQWLAFLLPMAYCLVAYAIIWAAGWGGFYNHDFVAQQRDNNGFAGWSDLAVLAWILPSIALFGMPGSLSSALGEEIGWRGFLVPELAKSMSFTGLSILTGVIWAAWHLPLIVLGNYHNNAAGALPLYGQLGMFFILVVSVAIILAYLRLKSGSLWTGALFHASHNLAVQAIFNPLTVQFAVTPKYADELGLVLPLVVLPIGACCLWKGRREFG